MRTRGNLLRCRLAPLDLRSSARAALVASLLPHKRVRALEREWRPTVWLTLRRLRPFFLQLASRVESYGRMRCRRRRSICNIHPELRRVDQRATVGVDFVVDVYPLDVVLQNWRWVLLLDGPEEVSRILFRHISVVLAFVLRAELERVARRVCVTLRGRKDRDRWRWRETGGRRLRRR